MRESLEKVRADEMTTDTRQSDNPNGFNPASNRGAPIGARPCSLCWPHILPLKRL